MSIARTAGLTVLTLASAALGAALFIYLGMPLAPILGSLTGAALVANLVAPMPRGRELRRFSQLFVGSSIGVILSPEILAELTRLLPMMLGVALASNLVGLMIAAPIARIAGIDRLSGLLSCLPAGMAEMATLARELNADEQSVAIIHTLRVIMVLTLIPFWLAFTGHAVRTTPSLHAAAASPADLAAIGGFLVVSLALALLAHRLRMINAFVMTPMLLCIAAVAAGFRIPAVPQPLLLAAQVGIGTSLGLRFRLDRMSRLPRVAVGGLVSGVILVATSFVVLSFGVEKFAGLDHLSAILATAPGGLGEMIASAGALGVLAASVAGFQLARSILTNLLAAPLIRWAVERKIKASGTCS